MDGNSCYQQTKSSLRECLKCPADPICSSWSVPLLFWRWSEARGSSESFLSFLEWYSKIKKEIKRGLSNISTTQASVFFVSQRLSSHLSCNTCFINLIILQFIVSSVKKYVSLVKRLVWTGVSGCFLMTKHCQPGPKQNSNNFCFYVSHLFGTK